jgi:putative tricarboxylic transport membrane protein
MIKNTTLEVLFTLFLVIFSVWVIIEGYTLSLGNLTEIGPGFLIFSEGIFLGVLCLAVLRSLFRGSRDTSAAFFSYQGLKGVLLTIGITLVVAVFFETLGFVLSAAVLLIFLLRLVGEESWRRLLLVAGFTVFFSYCIFNLLLKVQLPTGPLGF